MAHPLMTALMDVFPNAMRAIAAHTLYGSQKHNPGGTKHWAYHVSTHHADAAIGHLMERGNIDPESGSSHSVAAAWRAVANLETELIEAGAKPGRSVDFERGAPKPTAYDTLRRMVNPDGTTKNCHHEGFSHSRNLPCPQPPEGGPDLYDPLTRSVLAHPAQKLCVQAFKREIGSEFPVPVIEDVDDEPTCWACGRNVLSADTLCLPCDRQRAEEDGHE